ncbi:MAG TPA: hypothetical protein VK210_16365 [Terriglobia bacterium]|nr:hypothetical protein [Terriglobia bacterium]
MRRALLVFLLSLILVVSRRPDVLFHAQFWAEDGRLWFADAYNCGLLPLLQPAVGYFQTLPRLAALMAQALPLAAAPLFLNVIAILIQVLPVPFLLSSRCRELGSYAARCLFALLYIGLPNSHEMHANITNAQWRLALLALLVLFARPGRTALWNAFDVVVVALCALTGPFIIFIAPIAAILYFKDGRDRWQRSLMLMTGAGGALEILSVLLTGGSHRPIYAVRGATTELLIQILARQVFLAPLLGRRTVSEFSFHSGLGLAVALAVTLIGLAIELYVVLKAPLAWKTFIAFCLCIFAVSLASPTTASPQWPNLLASGGVRYWFFPMLGFIASVIWLIQPRNPAAVRGVAWVLLVIMFFGVVQDWGHPRPYDFRFQAYARSFSEAPAGTTMYIPINPVGWAMKLVKH